MGILLGNQIRDYVKEGKIHVSPFKEDNLGPNSYDVSLNKILTCYVGDTDISNYIELVEKYDEIFIDMRVDNKTISFEIPEEGLWLHPGILYLGCTNEEAGSDHFVPMYEGRSSTARLGLQSHISAGFGDLGFKGQWTLEITVTHPLKVYPNVRVGQVFFHDVDSTSRNNAIGKSEEYKGKYLTQQGPTSSQMWKDKEFKKQGE